MIEGCEGEGDTEGEKEGDGECEGASGRVFRTTGGGGPPRSGCDLDDGAWVDRRGGGGGGGSFDLGSDES